jgi:hypothetical protein
MPQLTPREKKTPSNKKVTLRKKNKVLFNPDFSTFDTSTGVKVASRATTLASFEASSEARKTRRAPVSKEETAKDAATGGSLSYLVGRAINMKDSKKVKFLTSTRKHGILGLAAAAGAAAMSAKKQKSEYNRQQAARELITGARTGRSEAYKKYLKSKYSIGDN